jgi:hypothetical protein
MGKFEVWIHPSVEDIEPMRGHMRQVDEQECIASSGKGAFECVVDGVKGSDAAWVVKRDGIAVIAYGVAPWSTLSQNKGIPWMLATDALTHDRALQMFWLRISKHIVADMLTRFEKLENYADARNNTTLKWLAWCGFKFDEKPVRYGVERKPFFRFTLERGN